MGKLARNEATVDAVGAQTKKPVGYIARRLSPAERTELNATTSKIGVAEVVRRLDTSRSGLLSLITGTSTDAVDAWALAHWSLLTDD